MRLILATLVIAVSCLGCSTFRHSSDDEDILVKNAVVEVAAEYIKYVVVGDQDIVASKILWAEYLLQDSKEMTKDDYFAQLRSLKSIPATTEHPLLGLKVVDVDVDGDQAEVVLQKEAVPESENIEIDLTWAGQGWLIANDSLFGKKGYISRLVKS